MINLMRLGSCTVREHSCNESESDPLEEESFHKILINDVYTCNEHHAITIL